MRINGGVRLYPTLPQGERCRGNIYIARYPDEWERSHAETEISRYWSVIGRIPDMATYQIIHADIDLSINEVAPCYRAF